MTNIAISGICQEMLENGQQNTLPLITVAGTTLVFLMEGGTAQIVAKPTFIRLTATSITRLLATTIVVYALYFM